MDAPAASATCRYLADWVTVKTRWRLSIDTAERAAIKKTATGCGDPRITVTHAR